MVCWRQLPERRSASTVAGRCLESARGFVVLLVILRIKQLTGRRTSPKQPAPALSAARCHRRANTTSSGTSGKTRGCRHGARIAIEHIWSSTRRERGVRNEPRNGIHHRRNAGCMDLDHLGGYAVNRQEIIEAMKRALEALESCDDGDYSTGHVIYPSFNDKKVDSAIVTLSAAIEELEKAEPVAWMGSNSNENGIRYLDFIIPADWLSIDVVPLYAHPSEDKKDAERYRMLRRGQHWSVIDGIGDTLIADGLDAAIDATMLKTPNVQIEPPSRPYATGRLERRVRLHVDCGNTNNA